MKYKVMISAPYMHYEKEKILGYLKEYDWEVDWISVKERLEEHELLKLIPNYHGIICGDDRFSAAVYETAKRLKAVVKWGTGIDSIEVEEATKRGIRVFRTPNAFTVPVAETTLAYMLSFARNVIENDNILKSNGWSKPQGFSMSEKTVGIIGFGMIGKAVALRLNAFGTKVIIHDLTKFETQELEKFNVTQVELNQLLEESDFITLHCDLNPQSFHLINSKAFKKMKKKPYIINTARGPIIEEAALIEALNSGSIKGAGLDVFEEEPLSLTSPLRKKTNVLLAAHNSNSSQYYWDYVHKNSLKMMDQGLKS
ncbi:MAG: phosphoglycerate dehydrogenase [Bacteriovorax sp.]|jgi:phosphoglycerate dehydrogenase-like enzyme